VATNVVQAADQTAIPPPPLRRNLRFQTLWIGIATSTFGVAVANIAYPLMILAITGSPAKAGLFGSVQAIAMLAAGLPTGSLADRHDSRTIVIIVEACRVMVTIAVVMALVYGWLSFPILLVAAVLLGIGQAVKSATGTLLVRQVVPPEQLTRALTQDEVRLNGAAIAGPAIGGALYAIHVLAHAVPFMVTAGLFLVSLLTAVLMRILPSPASEDPHEPGSAEKAKSATSGGMLVGVRMLWAHPVLRTATLLIMGMNTIGAGLELIIIVILRHQAVSSEFIGLALGVGAAGGLAGAPLIKPLHRLRPGVLLLLVCALDVVMLTLLALPFGPGWVAALLFTVMLGLPAMRVLIDILVIRQAPPEQRGRTIAALMTLFGLGTPIGLAGAGLLLQHLPGWSATLVVAALEAAVVIYCATKRELWRATWPS
jgi:MFS family permease